MFEEQQLEKQLEEVRFLTQVPKHKLTRAEKRRLAREKKIAAWRMAAKRQKQLTSLAKVSPVVATTTQTPVGVVAKPDALTAEKQAAQAKKALARERWLKKVAARKKAAQQGQLKKQNLDATEAKPRQPNHLPQTPTPSPF